MKNNFNNKVTIIMITIIMIMIRIIMMIIVIIITLIIVIIIMIIIIIIIIINYKMLNLYLVLVQSHLKVLKKQILFFFAITLKTCILLNRFVSK